MTRFVLAVLLSVGSVFAADSSLPTLDAAGNPHFQFDGFLSVVAGKEVSGRNGRYAIPDSFDETWSRFLEQPRELGEAHQTTSLSQHYDQERNMALQVHYDRFKDRLYLDNYDVLGDAKVIASGLDMVF
jgi:hypothetical protein